MCPVNVYVHGGAWRNGKATAPLPPRCRNAGANFVVLDFMQIQRPPATYCEWRKDVRSAVAWVYKTRPLRRRPQRVDITGHSSGAHLSGCASVTDWQERFRPAAGRHEGGLLVSGMNHLNARRI